MNVPYLSPNTKSIDGSPSLNGAPPRDGMEWQSIKTAQAEPSACLLNEIGEGAVIGVVTHL